MGKLLLGFFLIVYYQTSPHQPGGGGFTRSTTFESSSQTQSGSSSTSITTPANLTLRTGHTVACVAAHSTNEAQTTTGVSCNGEALSAEANGEWNASSYKVKLWKKDSITTNTDGSCTATFSASTQFRAIVCGSWDSNETTPTTTVVCSEDGCDALAAATDTRGGYTSITTSTDNAFMFFIGVDWDGNEGGHTARSGWTEREDGVTPFLFDNLSNSSGSFQFASDTASTDEYIGFLVSIE